MILVAAAIGFFLVLLGVPVAESYLAASGIYGRDQQKEGKPALPTSGGIIVLMGFIIAITFYAGATSIFSETVLDKELLFAAVSSTTLIALIGLVDDIHVDINNLIAGEIHEDVLIDIETGKTFIHEKADLFFGVSDAEEDRKGLSQAVKALMVLPAAFPLIAVGAGSWSMNLPFIGVIEWGLIYPLILLPVGLLFVSNVVNMLAGTNGLAASAALIASGAMGIFAYQNGALEAAALSLSLSAALIGFLYYNWYPATILPGDSLTYLSGATIFSAMVIGNMEWFGVFLFMPWMLEFFLKARSGFDARSWGDLDSEGNLNSFYDKNYSLTHFFMDKGLNEEQITLRIASVLAVWASFVLLLFKYAPFLSA